MGLWARLTGAALRAELEQARTTQQIIAEEYDDLVRAVVALQDEISEATDGQIQFVPKVTCFETPLVRQHDRKQFHSLVDLDDEHLVDGD